MAHRGHFPAARQRIACLESVSPKRDLEREEISRRSVAYAKKILALFRTLLLEVIRRRCPQIEKLFTGEHLVAENDSDLLHILQARGIWFQLLNILEQNATMRRHRDIETSLGQECNDGTFMQIFANARAKGLSAKTVQKLIDNTLIQPVITAHPTESKRITVLKIHRRIYLLLKNLEVTRWTPRERNQLIMQLHDEIDLLWMTGEIRLTKPSVEEEISWGCYFFRTSLFEVTGKVHEQLYDALESYYPDITLEPRSLMRFGSWIGGDRDGNPYVTEEITREALFAYRETSLRNLQAKTRILIERLSVAEHTITVPGYFRERLDKLLNDSGHRNTLETRNPGELCRQYACCMLNKINESIAACEQRRRADTTAGYRNAEALLDDLKILYRCLNDIAATGIARRYILQLIHTVDTFGFRTAALDLRENTTCISRTLSEILEKAGLQPPEDHAGYCQWVAGMLDDDCLKMPRDDVLSEETIETVKTFQLIRNLADHLDDHAFGSCILSMTRSEADILNVYLLARLAGLFRNGACRIPVVPLLETIEDLHRGPGILEGILAVPSIRNTLRSFDNSQEIMIGYSDSNKDGGFVCSNWETSKAQQKIHAIGKAHGISISFFHGRGGSSSRGGAPTSEAIIAQPPFTVDGIMRVTEQGEVVSAKFANLGTAEYQLETSCAAAMEHSLFSGIEERLTPNREFDSVMEQLSAASFSAYRELGGQGGLLAFYEAASPVRELPLLKIGSRPAQRFGAGTIEDLRAIPWVFAWSQNRMMVPGWFGFGSAVKAFTAQNDHGVALLRKMLIHCPVFRLITNEVEKNLSQVNLDIATAYAALVSDTDVRDRIFGLIKDEYHLSSQMLLEIVGKKHLCERFPRFERRLERRLPVVNQAGVEQVRLISELRSMSTDARHRSGYHQKLVALLLSINCVAAGLGWTG